ncbi:MAG: M13 family metallopeptidase N-terminal domain-containing protein [Lacunisphaera sp.]
MDTTVSPGADFARYAWGHWQDSNPVPADKSRWGSFNELDQYNQNGLKGILDTASTHSHEPGSIEQKVGDFYASAMDTAAIDAAGTKPIETDLARWRPSSRWTTSRRPSPRCTTAAWAASSS